MALANILLLVYAIKYLVQLFQIFPKLSMLCSFSQGMIFLDCFSVSLSVGDHVLFNK